MTTEERQQRMAERILEDENLRGDLEDEAATALVDWASKRAAAAAADPASTDADVEAQVQAIRQAARTAARSGETAPQRLIALAAAKLAPSGEATHAEPPAARPGPGVATDGTAAEHATPATAAVTAPQTSPARGAADIAGKRPQRKRSRLARFFKRVLGGR